MAEIFVLLLAGHLIGDWIVQTDRQALTKSCEGPGSRRFSSIQGPEYDRRWWRSIRANQAHCLTYHLTMAAFVLPAWHTWGTVLAFAVSWASHGFIDRRWPVRWLLHYTGSRDFAQQLWGVIAADQALHLTILALIAVAHG